MISYRENVDNKEYIDIISAKVGLGCIVVDENISEVIRNEANEIYRKLFVFERTNRLGYVVNITLKKDSLLGEFIINNSKIYIKYDDIINAYNVAVYENNPIAEQLLPLFRENVCGYIDDLINIYNKDLIFFIVNCVDFKMLADKNKKENKVVVYENGYYEYKVLSNNSRVRKK